MLQRGFDVNVYQFSSVTTLLSPSVYTSAYKSLSKVASNNGIVSPISFSNSVFGTVTRWGMTYSNSYVIMEILTYLYGEFSGIYRFSSFAIDSGGMLFIGENSTGLGSSKEYVLYVQKPSEKNILLVDSNVYLAAGGYYPLRIVYYNTHSYERLDIRIYKPSGVIVDPLKVLFNVPPSSQTNVCELMNTVYPTNSVGQPTNSDGVPVNSNGQPTNSDGAPTNSNGQPTNSDGAPTNSDGAPTNSNGQPNDAPSHTVGVTSEVSPVYTDFALQVENVIQSPSSYNIVFDDKEFALSYSLSFTNLATVIVAGDRTDTYPTCIATFVIQATPNEVMRKRDIFDITLTATVSFPEDTGRVDRSSDVSVSIKTAITRTTDISFKEENSISSASTHNIEGITDSIMSAESTTQAVEEITTSNAVISHYNHSSDIVGNAIRCSPTSGVSFGILILIFCLF
ncbi:unnamed protein product [[Candida] boidinii]|nr:hypothetical protein B5S30_g5801 [[Candida] boidinii]GMF50589.1 unnamed protein product [[Candida] boidinii]